MYSAIDVALNGAIGNQLRVSRCQGPSGNTNQPQTDTKKKNYRDQDDYDNLQKKHKQTQNDHKDMQS